MHINLFPARIVNWKISRDKLGKVWKVTRADGKSKIYNNIESLVKFCDREDLDTLWKLVQLDLKIAGKADVKEQELFVDLKRMYEPNPAYVYWNFPTQDRTLLWKFYDSCNVHHLSTKGGVDIFMLTEMLIGMMSSTLQCDEQTDVVDNLILSIGGQLPSKICEELDNETKAKKRKSF